MLFKNIILSIMLSFLVACVPSYKGSTKDDDYQIGDKVTRLSSMVKADGSEQNKIAIFDETARKIHLFDLDSNTLNASLDPVESSESEMHSILYDNLGNYIIDMRAGGFAIINKYNQANRDPIALLGNPLSAAFRADIGWLVVYDDVGSVGLLKLNVQGEILKSWVGGSRLNPLSGVTISSGDVLDNGHLIVSLSDGNIADIDMDSSVTQRKWVYATKTTGFATAKWISRVPDNIDQVFLRMNVDEDTQKIYLFDLNTSTVLDDYEVDGYLEKSARRSHPHFVIGSLNNELVEIIYPENNLIQKMQVARQTLSSSKRIVSSQLSIDQDSFSIVETQVSGGYFNPDLTFNSVKENRVFKKYRLSDMLLTATIPLANQTKIEVSDKYVLALYPHKLGYAVSYETGGQSQHEFKFFNRGHLKN